MTCTGVINNINPLSAMYGVCSHDLRIRNENCTSFVLISKLFCVLLVTFCEKNGLAEVEDNPSNISPVCDDIALNAVLCICSQFFCLYEVG